MTDNLKHIINYTEGKLSGRKMLKFEKELQINEDLREDYRLYLQINEYIHEMEGLDEVLKDPDLKKIDQEINEAVSEYLLNPGIYEKNRSFIEESLHEKVQQDSLQEEINQIKKEIAESNLNVLTEKLVNEYLAKKNASENINSEVKEMRNFIAQSLASSKENTGLKIVHKRKKEFGNKQVLRIISLSAAALLSGFILFKELLPSNNPEKLFASFYKTYNLESQITRNIGSNISNIYEEAVDLYNKGKYDMASPLFSSLIQGDTITTTFSFFLGITELERGNYANAIHYLSKSLSKPQEFSKEAQWYLGLSYLKLGEKEKAIPYFETLSASEGYYKNQAAELLRRLK